MAAIGCREIRCRVEHPVAIFGGFAPFIAAFLVRETGSSYAPAFYVIAAAIVTGIVLLRTRETAFAPLRLRLRRPARELMPRPAR